MSIDYRKISDMDEFNSLINSFLETRKQLNQKIKEERGETVATLQVGDKPLTKKEPEAKIQAKPVVEAIEKLQHSIRQKETNYNIFERYANDNSKKTTEVRAKRKGGKTEWVIGNNGVVNEADIQDDLFRLRNSKDGRRVEFKLTPSLAKLVFKPFKDINPTEIAQDAWIKYLQIMLFSGVNPKSNRNRKLAIARGIVAELNKRERRAQQQREEKVSYDDDETKSDSDVDMENPEERGFPPAPPPPPASGDTDDELMDDDDDDEGRAPPPGRFRGMRGIDGRYRGERGLYKKGVDMETQRETRAEKTIRIRKEKKAEAMKARRRALRGNVNQNLIPYPQNPRQPNRRQPLPVDPFQGQPQRKRKSAPTNEEIRYQREFRSTPFRQRDTSQGVTGSRKRKRTNPVNWADLPRKSRKKGSGLNHSLMTADQMIEKLHLMTQSQTAGNLSSTMKGQMVDLMDALYSKKIITKKQHKILYDKFINY